MAQTESLTFAQVVRRVVRRVSRRALGYTVRRPFVVLLAIGLLAVAFVAGPTVLRGMTMSTSDATPASDAAELYLRGMRDRDAASVLESLSPEMRRALEERAGQAGTPAVAMLFADQERRGERIVDYQYIGSYDTIQGDGLRFYVVRAQRGNERRDVPYTLTLSRGGKVIKIE